MHEAARELRHLRVGARLGLDAEEDGRVQRVNGRDVARGAYDVEAPEERRRRRGNGGSKAEVGAQTEDAALVRAEEALLLLKREGGRGRR